MKAHGKRSMYDTFVAFQATVKSNRRLWTTPLCTAFTLLVSGVSLGYYETYKTRVKNQSSLIYKESLTHLEKYEPAHTYIGTPYKVGWMEETRYDESTMTMVVPIKGPNGRARLYIFGRKGKSNEVILDHLDIELTRPSKRWTFYRQVPQGEGHSKPSAN